MTAPTIEEQLARLHPSDPLPPLDQTGWEEPMLFAGEMSLDPDSFVLALGKHNRSLAAQCLAQPTVRARVATSTISRLQEQLLSRSRNKAADLRERIVCAEALGALGDPRFKLCDGAYGAYLLPPLIEVDAGDYPIGDNDVIEVPEQRAMGHQSRHSVELAPLAVGQFPVTNAEWRRFMEAGGYEDKRWWDTVVARQWRRGKGVAQARRDGARDVVESYRALPNVVDQLFKEGVANSENVAFVRRMLAMSETELQVTLIERFPEGRESAPRFWHDTQYNNPTQPVIGITWYEARAYCNWLAAQTGRPFRLPTEVEWEAAARGREGRLYAYGDTFNPFAANVIETHLRRPSPIGVFPEGNTPEGACDLSGSVWEWTSSAWGTDPLTPLYAYPYAAGDGRENPHTPGTMRRVTRGGSALTTGPTSRTAFRGVTLPGLRVPANGMRVACSLG